MGEVEKARQDVIHASKIAAKAKFALWDATSAQKKITDSISADITAGKQDAQPATGETISAASNATQAASDATEYASKVVDIVLKIRKKEQDAVKEIIMKARKAATEQVKGPNFF